MSALTLIVAWHVALVVGGGGYCFAALRLRLLQRRLAEQVRRRHDEMRATDHFLGRR